MLVGSVCAGKSSLLNKQLKLELKTGKGHTTKDIKVVASSSTVEIVDTPGISIDEFNLYEM
jgi:putative ribosome biogenesis GTPase RsgA